MGSIPWSLIATVLLKVIDFILSLSKKKEAAKRQMLDFVRKHDERVMDNVKIRKEYDDIIKREYHAKQRKQGD